MTWNANCKGWTRCDSRNVVDCTGPLRIIKRRGPGHERTNWWGVIRVEKKMCGDKSRILRSLLLGNVKSDDWDGTEVEGGSLLASLLEKAKHRLMMAWPVKVWYGWLADEKLKNFPLERQYTECK